MTPFRRLTLACFATSLAVVVSNCGDGLDLIPNLSAPGQPVSTPTPARTATPGATATPTPGATPSPGPGLTCSLPDRPDCGNNGCCTEGGSAQFDREINDAQADLERTRPDIFHGNGSLKIDELEYTSLLAKKITSLFGICAVGGGRGGESRSKDEVGIKRDNNLSQNIDVIIGSSNTPYIGGRYTCRPASF